MFIYYLINAIKYILNAVIYIYIYIYSPDSIKSERAAINRINKKDDKCFQKAITVGPDNEEVGRHPQGTTAIMPFFNKHNWDGINYPS